MDGGFDSVLIRHCIGNFRGMFDPRKSGIKEERRRSVKMKDGNLISLIIKENLRSEGSYVEFVDLEE